MKKYTLLLTILLSGCTENFHAPKIIDTSLPYVGVHYDKFDTDTPLINPYTFNPTCQKDDDGKSTDGDCTSYYSVAMGLKNAKGTSIESDFIQHYDADKKDNALYMAEIKERILKRDALIEALLAVSREATALHQASTQADQTKIDILFGLGQAGTSAAASVAGGAAGKALSAATTGITASKSTVSKEFYQDQIAGHINNIIEQEQEKKLIEIRKSLANKDIYEYSVDRGIADVLDYHESGSLYKGLELVSVELAKTVNDNKNFKDNEQGKLNLDEEMKGDRLSCYMEDKNSLAQCLMARKRDLITAKAVLQGTNDENNKTQKDVNVAEYKVIMAKQDKCNAIKKLKELEKSRISYDKKTVIDEQNDIDCIQLENKIIQEKNNTVENKEITVNVKFDKQKTKKKNVSLPKKGAGL